MATPVLLPALTTGEISPSLFGRVDIDRERIAASTMRNFWVNFTGGASSRAGTKFIGFSKQTGRTYPPRLIPFQFSINQGLELEFGHEYMRVISNGGFVTEAPVGIGGATNADPCVLTFGTSGAATATPTPGTVTGSYAQGDLVSLDGGTYYRPAVLEILTCQLAQISPNARGTGYAVSDTVTLGGGTAATAAVATVATLASVSATGSIVFVSNPSNGDTITMNGSAFTFRTLPTLTTEIQIGASLSATLGNAVTVLNASTDANVNVATYSNDALTLFIVYDTPGTGGNAYTLAAGVATPSGANLTGGTATGIGTLTVTTAGNYSVVPVGGAMTQSATSGGGTGASFQSAIFAPLTASVSNPGAYTATPTNPVAQLSTDGDGLGATFAMTWSAVSPFSNGDWVYVQNVEGMTEINGNTYVVAGATATTINLTDVYGNAVDATGYGAYTTGGTVSRIYTLATPYQEEDIAWLKFTQSADVMTLCCVNQVTGVEYQPKDLARNSNTNWSFSDVVAGATILPPSSPAASIVGGGGGSTYYAYAITAVSALNGSESIASARATAVGASMVTVGNVQANVTWSPVDNTLQYNIYKAALSEQSDVPVGSLLGYCGTSFGTKFTDANITPDFTTVAPTFKNPFARGQVVLINITYGGSGYAQASTTATLVSGTGTGVVLTPVVQSGAVTAVIVENGGSGYVDGDMVSISGAGAGATAVATIGANTGTYPSVPSYFQQRRAFGNSLNNPDTYWMSKSAGEYTNFDIRIPTIDTDAITGSPWSVQVNGIQWMVQTAGGLLVLTGHSAWLLVGQGSFATNVQAISPSNQAANPQPFTGASPTVPPIPILFDILYVTAKGSYVYQLPYQGYAFSEPIDLTQYASHLFTGYVLEEWAWCEQPFKLIWAVRNDGTLLSLSYLKAEQVMGWARHDTDGYFESCAQVTEPPVDALYVATKRFPGTHEAYMIERMDDRIWPSVEDCWCVDCGLRLPQPTPNGTLSASSATGLGAITGVTDLVGGAGYSSATTATITDEALDVDQQPIGSGATATVTVVGGVITTVNITAPGAGYIYPKLTIIDPQAPAGGPASSASAHLTLDNSATFTSNASVFAVGDIGSVIRMGGGVATITARTSATEVTANITTPITDIRPNSGGEVRTQEAGEWTMTAPTTSVSGLLHLAGATVTGLADGRVVSDLAVDATGAVTLPFAASAVTLGLGFQAQVQAVPIDVGSPTVQAQRKKIPAASALVDASRSVRIGANQPDGSKFRPPQIAPEWSGMTDIPDADLPGAKAPYNSDTVPLGSGWVRTTLSSGWGKLGQVAVEQNDPLPMNLIALVPEILAGDTPSQTAGKDQ